MACPYCRGNCNCRVCLKKDLEVVCALSYCFIFFLLVFSSFLINEFTLTLQDGNQEEDPNVKLQKFLYLLHKIIPVLKHIEREQKSELEIEGSIRGIRILFFYTRFLL